MKTLFKRVLNQAKPDKNKVSRKEKKEKQAEAAYGNLQKTKFIMKNWKREQTHLRVNTQQGIVDEIKGKDKNTGHFVRVLMIKGYPPMILAGYLDKLDQMVRKENAVLRKTVRYAESDIRFGGLTGELMKMKLKRLEKSIEDASSTDPARPGEVIARDTIIALRDSKAQDDRKIVEVFTYLTISAEKLHQLEAAVNNLKSWFKNVSGKLDDLKREQAEAMRKTSPAHGALTTASQFFDKHHKGHITLDSVAARTYPMTRGSSLKTKGAYLGARTEDGSFRFENICDPTDERAQNITVIGKTGQGKSYFMKALIVSLLDEGVHCFVFDLDGEWEDLCKKVGGTYIDHTTEEGKYFDPLVIMPKISELDDNCIKYNRARYMTAVDATSRTFSLLGDGLSNAEKSQVGKAITKAYEAAGVHSSPDRQDTWDESAFTGPRPTIHTVYENIKAAAEDEDNPKRRHAESVHDKIEIYFEGIYSHIFGVEERLVVSDHSPLIVYKVGNGITSESSVADETAKQAQLKMSMSFDAVDSQIKRLKFEGIFFSAVLVDEGQRQIKNIELKYKMFGWYTSIRKWNGMMILGTNTPEIMLDSPEGKGMWQNTNIRVFFYMERNALQSLESESDVPIEIQERIAANENSKRYIMEYHAQYDELKMIVPPEEHVLYKTRGLREAS